MFALRALLSQSEIAGQLLFLGNDFFYLICDVLKYDWEFIPNSEFSWQLC